MKRIFVFSCVAMFMFVNMQQNCAARVIADSVADFSSTQGQGGWTYLYKSFLDSSWTQMTYQSDIKWYAPPASWIRINATTQNYNEGYSYWTNRTYTSTQDYGPTDVTFTMSFDGGLFIPTYYNAAANTTTLLAGGAFLYPQVGSVTYRIGDLGVGDKIMSIIQNSGGAPATYDPQIRTTITALGLFLPADISGPNSVPDHNVNFYDIAAMAASWLKCNDPCNPACQSAVPPGAKPAGYVYVDSVNGNDNNTGWTASEPLKTLANIDGSTFGPGQRILLKAGSVFDTGMTLHGSGSAGKPIIVDKYGTGAKPVLHGGLWLHNVEYWDVNNIKFDLLNDPDRGMAGIQVNEINFGCAHHLHFTNLDIINVKAPIASDGGGIWLQNGEDSTIPPVADTWFDDVLIQNCTVTDSDAKGILVSDWPGHGAGPLSTNVVIRGNTVQNVGSNGILVCGTNGALVEHNTVHYAGVRASGGVAGLFPVGCSNTLVQYNEVSHTAVGNTAGYVDGEGFDDDVDDTGSIFQYNYSHNNAGGFMLFTMSNGTIVRYNISQNDSTRIFCAAFGAKNASIYNNVFYVGSGSIIMTQHYSPSGPVADNFDYYNNIFYAVGTMTYNFGTMTNLDFQNNNFYGNNTSPPSQTNPVVGNPLLVSPGAGGNGMTTVDGYKLQAGSPCINAGKIISGNGGLDFWGNSVPAASAPAVGAHQR